MLTRPSVKSLVSRLRDFIVLSRPLFLGAGVVFHLLGLSIALLSSPRVDWLGAGLLQLVVTFTQLMTHFSNDYYDREGDALNRSPTLWSGGSRLLQEGRFTPRVPLIAALVCALVVAGGIAGLMLADRPGPLALPLLVAAPLLAWFYSAPPLRLVARGWGEVIAALIIAGATPLLGYYIQTHRIDPLLIAVIAPLILVQFATVLAVSLPDSEADAASGKRTLVVRLGHGRAGRVYVVSLAAAYVLLLTDALTWPQLRLGVSAAFVLAPLAAWQGWHAARSGWRDSAQRGTVPLWTIAVLIGTALIEAGAFAWLAFAPQRAI